MKMPLLIFVCLSAGAIVAGAGLAQNPPPTPIAPPPPPPPQVQVPRRVVNLPQASAQAQVSPPQFVAAPIAQSGAGSPDVPTLKQNYLVKLAVSQDEESIECSVVTASTVLDLKAVGAENQSVLVYLSGSLAEPDDATLVVQYTVGISFSGGGGANHQESARGVLRAKPGVRYPILTSGKRTYSLTITPFTDGKPE